MVSIKWRSLGRPVKQKGLPSQRRPKYKFGASRFLRKRRQWRWSGLRRRPPAHDKHGFDGVQCARSEPFSFLYGHAGAGFSLAWRDVGGS